MEHDAIKVAKIVYGPPSEFSEFTLGLSTAYAQLNNAKVFSLVRGF